MRPKSSKPKATAEKVVKDIRRATRRHFSAEDKIRIVLEGLRGDDSIAELCRKEGIAQSLYYTWSKEFMEAGKRRLAGDTARAATSDEVKDLRRESRDLKECVADLTLENRLLKKSMLVGEEAQPVRGTGENRMATTHEVSRHREAGDHQAGRAVASASQADVGSARHPAPDLLPLV